MCRSCSSFRFSFHSIQRLVLKNTFDEDLKHSVGIFEDVEKNAFEFIRKAVSDFSCASEAASAIKIAGNCEQSENMSFFCV